MSHNRRFHYSLPTNIAFGPGVIAELSPLLKKQRESVARVLVVTMSDIPASENVTKVIADAGFEYTVFEDVEPNPSTTTVEKAASAARESNCDLVVAVGGGSAMDTAKAAALVATNGGKAWDYTVEVQNGLVQPKQKVYPIIAVPTTAGTGAEVTQNSVLTNPETHQKSPIRSLAICPQYAFIDPELTVTMPRNVTVATGFDAFTHAFEKVLGPDSFPYIDAIAIDAMTAVVDNLEQAAREPENIEARSALHWASTQGGLSVLAESWESALHVFSLPLSGVAGIPHGETLALTMPAVLKKLTEIRPERVALLSNVFSTDDAPGQGDSVTAKCKYVEKQMLDWLSRLGLSLRLADYGLSEPDIEKLVDGVNFNRLNASWERKVSRDEVKSLYAELL